MIEREELITVVHSAEETSVVEQKFDITLRPQNLKEYIGQEEIKGNLAIFLEAAKRRNEPVEHFLLHGAPGLGKTTLANIIAKEMGVAIKITSGPALERQGDLASLLSNIQDGDVVFIDEIHRLKPQIEEILYTAMEDFALDLVLGKGPSARVMRLSLPSFTLIGATTKMSMISAPLRDRFGHVFKLEYYKESEILQIVSRSASLLKMNMDDGAAAKISSCARQTPRIANRLLRRVRDVAEVQNNGMVSIKLVEETLKQLGVDHLGLDSTDRQILKTLIGRYKGGPVGLKTLSAAIAEDEDTMETIYEPFLLQLGLLERTQRGRLATDKAFQHLQELKEL